MALDISALFLLIASSVVLGLIVFRKFSILSTINVDAVPQEKLEKKKEDIIETRLKRKGVDFKNKFSFYAKPVIKTLGNIFQYFYNKAVALEKHYQEKAQPIKNNPSLNQQKTLELISEGENLLKTGEYALAEKRFIEVIGLDHMNISAYNNLGEVYICLKDYEHAVEALRHAIKLDDADSTAYYDLSQVHKELGDNIKAVENLKKAVELDPNNPKYLDALIEASMLNKDKYLAEETFRRLKKANPENQKLDELKARIDEVKI